MINYALCPAVTVADIVRQVSAGAAWLYRNGGNFGAPHHRLHVAGHSAGGHLTAMMLAAQWPRFAPDLPTKVVQGGLVDERSLRRRPGRAHAIDQCRCAAHAALAKKVSPALMPPATDAPLYLAVGGKEQEGFHEQHPLIKERWAGVVRRVRLSRGQPLHHPGHAR